MKQSWWLFLGICLIQSGLAQQETPAASLLPVNKIFYDVPAVLRDCTLWVPAFDAPPAEEGWDAERRRQYEAIKARSEEANAYLRELLDKYYVGDYRLVKLSEVKARREAGARYFLDVVIMPKYFEEPEPRAMVAAFRKHSSANFLFTHHNTQFHYYFYLRDLQTDDAYLSSKFRGHAEVYGGMIQFLKRVSREMEE